MGEVLKIIFQSIIMALIAWIIAAVIFFAGLGL